MFIPDNPSTKTRVDMIVYGQIAMAWIYTFFIPIAFLQCWKRLTRLDNSRNNGNIDQAEFDDAVGNTFLKHTKFDLIFVALLWIPATNSNSPFHLAFLLPLMSCWLFPKSTSQGIFNLVRFCLGAHAAFAIVFTWYTWDINKIGEDAASMHSSHITLIYSELVVLLLQTVIFLFWQVLGLILLTLRHLRDVRKQNSEELEKALKSANQTKTEAVEAKKSVDAVRNEQSDILRALETLGKQQGHAVFIKNPDRKFVFANQVLLEQLAFHMKRKGFEPDANGRAKQEDIKGRTDEDLGLPNWAKYRESDDETLRTGHFLGFEPTVDVESSYGAEIWTQKEAIYDHTKLVGLVGCVVDGLPIEMQRMQDSISNSLVYASMKDKDGYIIWANRRHLEQLENRINSLLVAEKKNQLISLPAESKLREINGKRGPKDIDLYGEPASTEFVRRDNEIMGLAREHVCQGSREDFMAEFDKKLDGLIKSWNIHSEFDGVNPEKGWMELHRFPDAQYARWVEVRKMPWWGEWQRGDANGVCKRDVKGILVFFRDNHTGYMRKSVVWRWLFSYLDSANRATVGLLRDRLRRDYGTQRSHQSEELDRFAACALPLLIRRMLLWFRFFVDSLDRPSISIAPAGLEGHESRSVDDLRHLSAIIEEIYHNEVRIDIQADQRLLSKAIVFNRNGDELFIVVVLTIFNAIDATLKNPKERGVRFPNITVRIEINQKAIHFSIKDQGENLTHFDCLQINSLQRRQSESTAIRKVNGGFFLARQLADHLLGEYLLNQQLQGDPVKKNTFEQNPPLRSTEKRKLSEAYLQKHPPVPGSLSVAMSNAGASRESESQFGVLRQQSCPLIIYPQREGAGAVVSLSLPLGIFEQSNSK